MNAPDFVARGMAAASARSARRETVRERLRDCATLAAARPPLPAPGEIPALAAPGTAAWATSTAYDLGKFVTNGGKLYFCARAGTSAGSGTGPAATSGNIADGTAIWHCVGPLVPVAYANGQTLVAGQTVYAAGQAFEVTVGGTTAGSGSGPKPATLTDGTVTFRHVGRQTRPLMSVSTSAGAGLTKRVAWDGAAGASVLGGVRAQVLTNPRCRIYSRDARSSTDKPLIDSLSNGSGGSIFTVTDAPTPELRVYNDGILYLFVDHEMVAAIATPAGAWASIRFDFNGLRQPRRPRVLRALMRQNAEYEGWYGSDADVFKAYDAPIPVRAVHVGDSFTDGANTHFGMTYAGLLGVALGIDDYWVSGVGGTGVLKTNGVAQNYAPRFDRDVIGREPDLVIIQNTQNDPSGVPGSYSIADLRAALAALIARVRNELPNAVLIVTGQWNNRGALAGDYAAWEAEIADLCATESVPYIKWDDYLTEGGFVGNESGTGNSGLYTGSDGTHATAIGQVMRAERVARAVKAAAAKLG